MSSLAAALALAAALVFFSSSPFSWALDNFCLVGMFSTSVGGATSTSPYKVAPPPGGSCEQSPYQAMA